MNGRFAKVVLGISLAVCLLCGWQWVRESRLRQERDQYRQAAEEQVRRRRGLEAERERAWSAVRALEERHTVIEKAAATNLAQLADLQNRWQRLAQEKEHLVGLLAQHKAALEEANHKLARQNEDMRKQNKVVLDQNEQLKKLVLERDRHLERLNQRTKEFNDLAENYNDLARRLEAATRPANP